MDKLVERLAEFFSEFTWPRFFALLVVISLLVVAFSLFERYTSSFRLGRLQRTADLISKIQEIETTITNATPELRADYKALLAQTTEAVNSKPISLDFIPGTLRFSIDGLWKFLAGGSLWILLGLFAVREERKKGSSIKNLIGGFVVLAAISGFAGMFVPSIWWPWFHIFIWPLVFLFGVTLLLVPVIYMGRKFSTKKD
jgi:hypothetical protein